MTTPTPIPDFCVSSNADGFDEFLKVLSEYCKTIGYLNGAHRYYGLSSGGLDCGSQAWTTNELTPHAAIALLTKPLTEGDLIVGNMFECIEAVRLQGGEGHGKIIYIKGEVYECEYEGCITDHLYERHRFWNLSNEMLNRHFKLLPTQESVKERNGDPSMDEMIQLVEQLESDKFHLQQQLKEANLLLLNIKNTIELNNIQKVFPETYPQINQFLTRNK